MVHDNRIKMVNIHSSSMDHTSNNKEIKSPSFLGYTAEHIKDTTIAPSTHRDKLKNSLLLHADDLQAKWMAIAVQATPLVCPWP
jgi:hypothetical protein